MKTKKGKKQKILGNNKNKVHYDEDLNESEDMNVNIDENLSENEEMQEFSDNSKTNENENESLENNEGEAHNVNNSNSNLENNEEISIELRTSRNIVKQQEIYYSFIGLRILFQDILNIANNLPLKSSIKLLEPINPKILNNLDLTLKETENNMDNLISSMINKINKPLLSEKGFDNDKIRKPNSKFIKKYSNKIIDSWYKKTINSMNSNVGSLTQNLENGLHNYYLNYIQKSNYKIQIAESSLHQNVKNEIMTQRYDDTDFYGLLLKDFINFNSSLNLENLDDANEVDNILQQETLLRLKNQRERKSKISSSKLSKNRSINYQIHEKLTNFIAPEDYNDQFNGRKEILKNLFGIKWAEIIDSKNLKDNNDNNNDNKMNENVIGTEINSTKGLVKQIQDFQEKNKNLNLKRKNLKNANRLSKSKLSEEVLDSEDEEDIKLL